MQSKIAINITPPPILDSYLKDWYKIDPNTNVKLAPDYYDSDLITRIKDSAIRHEVASHGFSHLNFNDSAVTSEAAQFEIEESYRLLSNIYPELKTYVFPKNHPAFLGLVKKAGFSIFRSKQNSLIKKHENGMIEFPLGLPISPKKFSPKDLLRLLEIAISKKRLINFYLHLHEFESSEKFFKYFQPIFSYISNCQTAGTIKALTIKDIINTLI